MHRHESVFPFWNPVWNFVSMAEWASKTIRPAPNWPRIGIARSEDVAGYG